MYCSAILVANYFLELSKKEGKNGLSIIPLIKLPYIAHGFTLALTNGKKKLCSDKVEVWKYGPVYPEIYHAFKGQPSLKTKPATMAGYDIVLKFDKIEKRIMENVFDIYGDLKPTELSSLTHKKGTPWFNAKKDGRKYIEDKEIQDYYERLLKRITSQNEQKEG